MTETLVVVIHRSGAAKRTLTLTGAERKPVLASPSADVPESSPREQTAPPMRGELAGSTSPRFVSQLYR